jgi:hypothetical protein
VEQHHAVIEAVVEAQKALEAAVLGLQKASKLLSGTPAPVAEVLIPTMQAFYKSHMALTRTLLDAGFQMPASFGVTQEGFEAMRQKVDEDHGIAARLPLAQGAPADFSPAVLAKSILTLRALNKEGPIEDFFALPEPERHAAAIQGLVAFGEIGLLEEFLQDSVPAKVAIGIAGFSALQDAQLVARLEPMVLGLIDQPAYTSAALKALALQGTELALEALVSKRLHGGSAELDQAIVAIIGRSDEARAYIGNVLTQADVRSLENIRGIVTLLPESENILRIVLGATDGAYPRIKALGLEAVFETSYAPLRAECRASNPEMLMVIDQAWKQHIA